jgi:nicotinamide mononucleotide adenylyltransferase
MDALLSALAKEIPNAVALIVVVMMFLTFMRQNEDKRLLHDKTLEDQRVENAKQREIERRAHEIEMNSMWANYIKSLVEQVNSGHQAIVAALKTHEQESQDRYDRIGVTNDLLRAARDQQTKRTK